MRSGGLLVRSSRGVYDGGGGIIMAMAMVKGEVGGKSWVGSR